MLERRRRKNNKIVNEAHFVEEIICLCFGEDAKDYEVFTALLSLSNDLKALLNKPMDFKVEYKNQTLKMTPLEFMVYIQAPNVMSEGDTEALKNNDHQYKKLFSHLLKMGADPCLGSESPLCTAMCFPDTNILSIFLEQNSIADKKINFDYINKHGLAPIHYAVDENNVKALTLLLNKTNINIHIKSKYGQTPLELALIKNQEECIKLLFNKMVLEKPVLTNEKIEAIKLLIEYEQKSRAMFLLKLISQQRKTLPNTAENKKLFSQLESLFGVLLENEAGTDLYKEFFAACMLNDFNTRISGISDINHVILPPLAWVCLLKENIGSINFVKFLMNTNADPNLESIDSHDRRLRNPFVWAVLGNNIEIFKILLSSGKVSAENIKMGLMLSLDIVKNKDMVLLLEEYSSEDKNYMSFYINEAPIPQELMYAIIEDDANAFNNIKSRNLYKYSVLKLAIEFKANAILKKIDHSLNVFHPITDAGHSLFSILLIEENFEGLDLCKGFCLKMSKKQLNLELAHCSKILQKELFGKEKDCTQILKDRYDRMQNKIQSFKESIEISLDSFYSEKTNDQAFFKPISGRKYVKDELNISLQPQEEEDVNSIIQPEPVLSEKRIPTWFNAKSLAAALEVKKIDNHENRECYFVMMPGIDQSQNKIFEKNDRISFQASCLKKLKGINPIICVVDGVEFKLPVTHQLYPVETCKDRILVARKPSDDGSASLYIAFTYLANGLHTVGDTKQVNEFLKNSKFEFDILFRSPNTLNNKACKRI